MASIDSLITEARRRDLIGQQAVLWVEAKLRKLPDPVGAASAAINDYVLMRLRDAVRGVERRVYDPETDRLTQDGREQLLAEGFPLDGEWVFYEDATVEQFKGRIAELEDQRRDLGESIAFYHACIAQMRRERVARFGDLKLKPVLPRVA
jgi:hypothetical protein